jgi:hypothetical protein
VSEAPPDLSRLTFKFAKTMPETPHEYVVRSAENEADYVALFRTVQRDGVNERFGGRRYRYWYPGDGWKYWTMTTDLAQSKIINRAKVDGGDDPKLLDEIRF